MDALQCKAYKLSFDHPLIMGVLNVTPDSFSDGGQYFDIERAVEHAKHLAEDGADILDIGGESSRPGAEVVSEDEECRRILPVLEKLQFLKIPISVDTYKPSVAKKCLERGASIINDISGLADPEMAQLALRAKVPVVCMHMQGKPKTMQQEPKYKDVISEINTFFAKIIQQYPALALILDPGIGFGKTQEHNLQILHHLEKFRIHDKPILIGTSRKSFIGKIDESKESERLGGTIGSNVIAYTKGAHIFRVHDVKECKQALRVAEAIEQSR